MIIRVLAAHNQRLRTICGGSIHSCTISGSRMSPPLDAARDDLHRPANNFPGSTIPFSSQTKSYALRGLSYQENRPFGLLVDQVLACSTVPHHRATVASQQVPLPGPPRRPPAADASALLFRPGLLSYRA